MNSPSRIGCLMVVGVLGCGSASHSGETDNGGLETGSASSGTTALDCSMQPTVVVWLALNTGGLVSAQVEYSVAGGARVPAQECTQGACFIYEGAGQPIEVFARHQDCDESALSITGAVCPQQSSAELSFGFYEGCTIPTGTDGPPGTSGESDTDAGTGTGTGTGTGASSGGETGTSSSTGGSSSR